MERDTETSPAGRFPHPFVQIRMRDVFGARLRELLRSGLASVIIALFLAGSASEAAGLHRCPHHDRVASHSVHGDASHGAEDGGHECTCFGTCHGSATLALLAVPDDGQLRSHGDVGDPLRTAAAPAPRASSYLHPYANGPPTP